MSFKRSKYKDIVLIGKNVSIVSFSDKVHKNCLRIGNGETDSHALVKFWIYRWLRLNLFDVITECRFKNGKRADLFVLNYGDGLAIEVVCSETANSILDKRMSYPCKIEVLDCNKCFSKEEVFAWCEDTFSRR